MAKPIPFLVLSKILLFRWLSYLFTHLILFSMPFKLYNSKNIMLKVFFKYVLLSALGIRISDPVAILTLFCRKLRKVYVFKHAFVTDLATMSSFTIANLSFCAGYFKAYTVRWDIIQRKRIHFLITLYTYRLIIFHFTMLLLVQLIIAIITPLLRKFVKTFSATFRTQQAKHLRSYKKL